MLQVARPMTPSDPQAAAYAPAHSSYPAAESSSSSSRSSKPGPSSLAGRSSIETDGDPLTTPIVRKTSTSSRSHAQSGDGSDAHRARRRSGSPNTPMDDAGSSRGTEPADESLKRHPSQSKKAAVEAEAEAVGEPAHSSVQATPHSAQHPQAGSGPPSVPSTYTTPSHTTSATPAMSPSFTAPHSTPSKEPAASTHMDLATFPTSELLKLLASLLQQIASANDALRPESMAAESSSTPAAGASEQRESEASSSRPDPPTASESTESAGSSSRPAPTSRPSLKASGSSSSHPTVTTAARNSLSHPSSILCFHARNVPSISIEAYLQRILKYCPVTNEVFLSLLVYFDRMSRSHIAGASTSTTGTPIGSPRNEHPPSSSNGSSSTAPALEAALRGFAIDSYNVHRLIIAGITVASKFFSDVFYTNSRYAKVSFSICRRRRCSC